MDLRRDRGRSALNGRGAALGGLVAVAAVAVAWLPAGFGATDHRWAAVAAIVAGTTYGAAIRRARDAITMPGVLPMANVSAAVAIYACVPETGQMLETGVVVGLVLAVELIAWRPLPVAWHASAAAIVLWAGLYGASGRQSALAGALFVCVAVQLFVAWLALAPRLARAAEPWRWAALGAASFVPVLMARTGGISFNPATGWRWLAMWLVVAIALTGAVAMLSGRPAPRHGR